jgi:hypothetical protein
MGANAQTVVPTFVASQVLTADQMNQSARTGLPVFATTVTRDAAFGGTGEKTLAEGQLCYLESTDAVQVYDGAAWVNIDTKWTDYTPTWVNLTVGNATQDFRYIQLGKAVFVTGVLTFGSTTSMGTAPTMSLPITAVTYTSNNEVWASIGLEDTGNELYLGTVFYGSTTTVRLRSNNAASSILTTAAITSTAPFTWGTGDRVNVTFFYEAA